MNATDWLKRDHTLILEGLDALQAVATMARTGGAVPVDNMRRLMDFFRVFADEYHHRKEENALFPALQAAGMPVSHGPLGVMLREHDEGRRLLKRLSDDLPELSADVAFDYIALLSSHIQKENQILFHMADRLLSASDDQAISDKFSQVQDEMPHVKDHDAYRKLFADLRPAP